MNKISNLFTFWYKSMVNSCIASPSPEKLMEIKCFIIKRNISSIFHELT